MNSARILPPSGRWLIPSTRRNCQLSSTRRLLDTLPQRQLTTSARRHATANPTKPIVLEKPDKFRPPSHPQRLNRRAPRNYPGPALSETEREAQKTRRYPHTFPNPGTKLHWFLTTWWIHLCITMGTLSLLAFISLTQSFLHTSPFAHLVPPIRSLPFHPFSYMSEWISVIKLHTAYRTELVQQKRDREMLDTQKRRIYRRAHGMEDLDRAEDQGVDVRGIVPWDDGLTNVERRSGGRREPWKLVPGGGSKMYDPMYQTIDQDTGNIVEKFPQPGEVVEAVLQEPVQEKEVPPRRRKVKRWFGIWE